MNQYTIDNIKNMKDMYFKIMNKDGKYEA